MLIDLINQEPEHTSFVINCSAVKKRDRTIKTTSYSKNIHSKTDLFLCNVQIIIFNCGFSTNNLLGKQTRALYI